MILTGLSSSLFSVEIIDIYSYPFSHYLIHDYTMKKKKKNAYCMTAWFLWKMLLRDLVKCFWRFMLSTWSPVSTYCLPIPSKKLSTRSVSNYFLWFPSTKKKKICSSLLIMLTLLFANSVLHYSSHQFVCCRSTY